MTPSLQTSMRCCSATVVSSWSVGVLPTLLCADEVSSTFAVMSESRTWFTFTAVTPSWTFHVDVASSSERCMPGWLRVDAVVQSEDSNRGAFPEEPR
jgi:hypothetical protein